SHASSLGRCVSHMEDHVEEACRVPGPSRGTPERKRYPRPDKFSATSEGASSVSTASKVESTSPMLQPSREKNGI
ncbi:unnamed protein product, partial [Ascophyllum nodosum]